MKPGWRITPPAPPPHFPGGNARASLKPAHTLLRRWAELALPRRKRPGLIEARSRSDRGAAAWPHFPGGNARASLKRLQPQRQRGGGVLHFPGGNARASLKQLGVGGGVERQREHFPGGNARASLKHVFLVGVAPCLHSLPRRKRPGLIEAQARRKPWQTLSALPRRKRPGLIEAAAASVAAITIKMHFPGGNARASLKLRGRGNLRPVSAATSQAETPGPH